MKLIYVSVAMSLDGRIDDRAARRLVISSSEDLQDVYAARADCDAILIGANTIRQDNPSLLVDSPDLIETRVKRGQSAELVKVTISRTGDLNRQANFFSKGAAEKVIICPSMVLESLSHKLSGIAKIVPVQEVNARNIIHALENCGIKSLFIEGGTSILTMFLSQGVFHRLRLAIAPFFIGDSQAPSFISDTVFKNGAKNRLRIVGMRNLGNIAVLDIVNEGYAGA